LIERRSINEDGALEMPREQSRAANRKLIDLAVAVVDGHCLHPQFPDAVTPEVANLRGSKVISGQRVDRVRPD
jgi:hypothetical protein